MSKCFGVGPRRNCFIEAGDVGVLGVGQCLGCFIKADNVGLLDVGEWDLECFVEADDAGVFFVFGYGTLHGVFHRDGRFWCVGVLGVVVWDLTLSVS